MSIEPWTEAAGAAGIFLLSFLSEDVATVTGAFLATLGKLAWPIAFAACFLGIWAGDFGLYGLARWLGRPVVSCLLRESGPARLRKSEEWFVRHGLLALAVSRFIPGARLPTFLAAGLLKMPVGAFLLITGVLAAGWVAIIFAVFAWFEVPLETSLGLADARHLVGLGAVGFLVVLTRRYWRSAGWSFLQSLAIHRCSRWEFWPAWLFYLPVGINYLRLSIKYRSLSLPSAANPGMFTGGIIGESKQDTLSALARSSESLTAPSILIEEGEIGQRMARLQEGLAIVGSEFPIVLKPDVAQRGSGFKVIKNAADAEEYLSKVAVSVIAQQYVYGPLEAGLFYYRLPSESRGKIFAITEKIFPVLIGDGQRTVEALILADPRASLLADLYLRRFDRIRDRVLVKGESLRLVEAGNHAQGCLFQDGSHLWSSELEARIDAISQALPGFYIGRYDVRFSSIADLQAGRGFKILELNGAASEPTNAYDSSKSLRQAYGLLFRQWELVFAIGAENRQHGHRPDPILRILREWLRYQRYSLSYPLAD